MAPEENHEDMEQALAENSSSYANVKKWASEFKWGRNSTENDPRLGCPKTTSTDKQVDVIYCIVLDERHLTVQKIAKIIGINSGLVYTVLIQILKRSKMSLRWVPRF